MEIIGIIPSRYNSTRFPGKPLVDIGGKTMIQRVYEQAIQAKSLSDVIIATDDERIFKEVERFGGKVQMTSEHCKNGTERCAEVIASNFRNSAIIVNIQGDEPFINPQQIDLLADCFTDEKTEIATLIKEHPLNEELQNQTRVKVVVNKLMKAMYFSRQLIPFTSEHHHFTVHGFQKSPSSTLPPTHSSKYSTVYYKHIGIYAYRKSVLLDIVKLPPGILEMAENLEQLRWLENGFAITCALTNHDSISVDVPEDLAALKKFL